MQIGPLKATVFTSENIGSPFVGDISADSGDEEFSLLVLVSYLMMASTVASELQEHYLTASVVNQGRQSKCQLTRVILLQWSFL